MLEYYLIDVRGPLTIWRQVLLLTKVMFILQAEAGFTIIAIFSFAGFTSEASELVLGFLTSSKNSPMFPWGVKALFDMKRKLVCD